MIRESKRYSKEQKIYELYANIDNDYLAILDMLCCIGTGELYGTPSDLNESEMYIMDIIKILKKHTVAIPEIDLFKDYILNNPKKSMDYFGDKVDCTNLL